MASTNFKFAKNVNSCDSCIRRNQPFNGGGGGCTQVCNLYTYVTRGFQNGPKWGCAILRKKCPKTCIKCSFAAYPSTGFCLEVQAGLNLKWKRTLENSYYLTPNCDGSSSKTTLFLRCGRACVHITNWSGLGAARCISTICKFNKMYNKGSY